MKKARILWLLGGWAGGVAGSAPAWAQAGPARELVREGVALYDTGQYNQAANKYQQALAATPGDAQAQAELAMTYAALNRHDEAVALCQQLLAAHPEADPLVYATYGNSLDAGQRPAEALAVYRQALLRYPDSYILYFNQGVTLAGQEREAEAVASFQHALALNPAHASSHMVLGGVQLGAGTRVPAILALARFLVLEPGSGRSAQRRALLDQALLQGVSRADGRPVNIALSRPAAGPKKGKGRKARPDDFGPEEMFLSLAGALALDEKNQDKTKTERFIDQFGALCRVLGERAPAAGGGFTRTYYAPYFVELEKKGYVPAFAYLTHSSETDAPEVQQWLAAHPTEVEVFREWSKNYDWPKPAF
ncbi:tetratricopeptide repeat protein [Hymenobacter caeli]|uniref:Tetratricopeptide (TPR) repeat protein n=1 Tax=Hymenobacter caeli TaxID=2735894 RepID=A0ABX2FVN8_9BACT|nr:tetratricopeptide repeat protein [Hymenobacter caeli]NRT21256.1 tetratricopeptide (TPR) repeat protein [Hymenobacter caeli]